MKQISQTRNYAVFGVFPNENYKLLRFHASSDSLQTVAKCIVVDHHIKQLQSSLNLKHNPFFFA